MEFSRGKRTLVATGSLLVLFVLVAVASAQITMSRQWVRGKYPGDNKDGATSAEFERVARFALPKRTFTRYVIPSPNSVYEPAIVSGHFLVKYLERIKEPSFDSIASPGATGVGTLEAFRK